MTHDPHAEIRQRMSHPSAVDAGSQVDGAVRGAQQRGSRSSEGPTPENGELHGDAQFLHGSLLLTACAPSVGITLAFGGRPALLVLCFGALVAYIFDILGSVEVRGGGEALETFASGHD